MQYNNDKNKRISFEFYDTFFICCLAYRYNSILSIVSAGQRYNADTICNAIYALLTQLVSLQCTCISCTVIKISFFSLYLKLTFINSDGSLYEEVKRKDYELLLKIMCSSQLRKKVKNDILTLLVTTSDTKIVN